MPKRDSIKSRAGSEPKRHRALQLAIGGSSTTEIAKALSVGRSTVNRWRSDPEFEEELRAHQAETLAALHATLVRYSVEAVRVLREIFIDAEAPASARVTAVRTYFELQGLHKGAPVTPPETETEITSEEDVLSALDQIPEDLLREALTRRAGGAPKRSL